jgi:hypothetical protein
MVEVANLIEQYVQSNGGSVEWQAMVDAVPFQQRKWIIPALNLLKQENRVRRHIDGTVSPPTFRIIIPPQE